MRGLAPWIGKPRRARASSVLRDAHVSATARAGIFPTRPTYCQRTSAGLLGAERRLDCADGLAGPQTSHRYAVQHRRMTTRRERAKLSKSRAQTPTCGILEHEGRHHRPMPPTET